MTTKKAKPRRPAGGKPARTPRRKQTEAALEASEARLHACLEAVFGGFAILSAVRDETGQIVDFRYRYINEAGARTNERSREETLGRSLVELFPGLKGNTLLNDFVRTVETGEPLLSEHVVYSGVIAGGEPATRTLDVRAVKTGDGIAVSWMEVTEQRKTEEALKTSLQLLSAHLDNSPVAVVEFDPEFRVIRWSKEARNLFGWTAEETLGRTATEMRWVHDEDAESVRAGWSDMVSGKRPRNVHATRNYSRDGSVIHCEWYDSAIYDARGQLTSILSRVLDVSKRKRAEAALRESEKRYRTLFDAIDQSFCIIEMIFDEQDKPVDYRFLETNPAFERQTGQVGAKGRRIREVSPNHGEYWFETFGEIALTGQPARFQRWAETLRRWLDVYAFRFGRPEDRQVAVLFNDVTVQKAMEEDLHRRAEELKTVLESVPALVWIAHDPDCRRMTGNRLADEFLRLPRGGETSLTAPEGQRPTHFQAWKDGRKLAGEELPVQRAARGEVVTDFDFSVEFDDGTVRHILGNAMPLYDMEGETRGAVSAFIDVTERKAIEEDLRASLEEKDVLMRELAHRTKNNMQVIAGLLDLQAATVPDEKFGDVLSDTKNRIRAMALVHEKLYGSGNVSRLNMKEYVEDLAAALLFAHQGDDGRIKLSLDVGDFALSIDSALPCGLIINELIANSLKHAFPGRKTGTICLSLLRMGKEFELTYRDDGPGLPQGLDPSAVRSLGLKLVYNLAVRQLRGKMDVGRDPAAQFLFRFRDLEVVKRR